MNAVFSLVLDILVAILLVATICYAMVLNSKLSNLRRGKEEMEKLAASFGEATGRAEENIARLRETATELQNGIKKAQSLHDDLIFLIERGDQVADHLEEKVRDARKETGYSPRGAMPQKKEREGDAEDTTTDEPAKASSDAERELLKALRAVR